VTHDAPPFPEVFRELVSPDGISPELVRRVFDTVLAGGWTPAQIAAFMVALRLRGETAPVIAAAAEAMRAAMLAVDHGLPRTLDTCGTGGDGLGTLNLSTFAAIVAAACGVPVAKHGNRAVSSRAGSADVVEALGIPLDLDPDLAAGVLREAGIAFLMAPVHHPAMRHAAPVRKELGIRTIFNCLGPLANPARATHQLIGAYDDALRPVLAETLRRLGTRRAWVVRGEDGLDEVSPHGRTRVTELDNGSIRELVIEPGDFGLPPSRPGVIRGGEAAENARILELVLGGQDHPARDAFVLNAAAALVVAEAIQPRDATERVREVMRSGQALGTLARWRAVARQRRVSPAE
jgi:anthranilate phosphoribosyltransferase